MSFEGSSSHIDGFIIQDIIISRKVEIIVWGIFRNDIIIHHASYEIQYTTRNFYGNIVSVGVGDIKSVQSPGHSFEFGLSERVLRVIIIEVFLVILNIIYSVARR